MPGKVSLRYACCSGNTTVQKYVFRPFIAKLTCGKERGSGAVSLNPFPTDSFSKDKVEVIPKNVDIMSQFTQYKSVYFVFE